MANSFLQRTFALTLLFISTTAAATIHCNNSYAIQTTVNGDLGTTLCSTKAQQFIDTVKDLKRTNPNYTLTSAAVVEGRFNDVNVVLSYAAHSNELHFSAPEIGVESKVFSGSTRKQSQDEFIDWLKKDGILGDIMNYQAKHSATSPITGAGGLLPTIAGIDFDIGMANLADTTTEISNTDPTASIHTDASHTTANVIGLTPSFGTFSVDGSDDKVHVTTLPLSYTVNLDRLPNHQVILSAPMSMYQVGNAKGYHAGFGIAYRFPVNEHWSLTPSVRYSLTGSADRATLASVSNVALTSHYRLPMGKFEWSFGNMLGYYRTGKFKVDDYSFNPQIHQTMLRNGIMFSQPITIKGKKLAIEYSAIDTHYIGGQKPFLGNMQEYGITLGMHRDAPKSRWSSLRGGATLTRAKSAHGITFNFGYWF